MNLFNVRVFTTNSYCKLDDEEFANTNKTRISFNVA